MTSLSNPVLEAFLSVLDGDELAMVREKPRETQEALAQAWQDLVKLDLGDGVDVLNPAMLTAERDALQGLASQVVFDEA